MRIDPKHLSRYRSILQRIWCCEEMRLYPTLRPETISAEDELRKLGFPQWRSSPMAGSIPGD